MEMFVVFQVPEGRQQEEGAEGRQGGTLRTIFFISSSGLWNSRMRMTIEFLV